MPCCDTRNMYAGQPQKLSLQPPVTEQNRPQEICACQHIPTLFLSCHTHCRCAVQVQTKAGKY